MSTGKRTGLIVAGVLVLAALVGLGVIWFRHNFHQVPKTLYLPPSGEAGYNPLYALGKTLQADGVRVNMRQRLTLDANPLAPHDTVLLFNDPRVLSPDQQEQLLAWVESGGHLLLRTPPAVSGDDGQAPILDSIGVYPRENKQCQPLRVAGQSPHVEFCKGRRFDFDDDAELAWGDSEQGYVFARLAYGDGHVDVLSDFEVLVNQASGGMDSLEQKPDGGLRDVPHQAFARQLLAPNYRQGTMHLIYAAQMPSLLYTLLVRGWMVWVPLLLALLAWLYSRMQRFGPELPTPVMERRSLLEHVRASGDLLFRYGRGVLLYQAVRQAFFARLRRRDPVAAALAGDAQAQLLAKRFNLPMETVRDALAVPASRDHGKFRTRISTLIELRNRL